MKILFVTPEIRWPLASGGDIRQWHTLKALQENSVLDVIVFQPRDVPLPNGLYENCRRIITRDKADLRLPIKQSKQYHSTFGRLCLACLSRKPFEYIPGADKNRGAWVRELFRDERYDVIWISKINTAMALGWWERKKTILDGDDFDSVREYLLLRNSEWYGAKIANYINVAKLRIWERMLPNKFAFVARCSEKDFQRDPQSNVVILPNGADLPDYPVSKKSHERPRLLFVGSLGYAPNGQGLEWFFSEVWPLVRRQVPEIMLDIVGGGGDANSLRRWNGLDGVSAHGFVEDLASFWQLADLSIAPLLAGAGTRLKILESLAQMTPVVTTPIGAYGLELDDNHGVFCEKNPVSFASRITQLLADPVRLHRVASVGFDEVARRYNWSTIRKKMQKLLQTVAGLERSVYGNPKS